MLQYLYLIFVLVSLPAFAAERSTGGGPPLKGEMQRFMPDAEQAPFQAFRFRTLDGAEKTLADYRGRMVLLNVWATWCAPCVREMPSLDKLAAAYPREKLEIIALSVDRGGKRAVEQFLDRVPMEHVQPMLETDYTLQRARQLAGLPSTFLIDGNGRLLGTYLGPADWNAPETRRLIDWYLKAGRKKAPPAKAIPTAAPLAPVLPSP